MRKKTISTLVFAVAIMIVVGGCASGGAGGGGSNGGGTTGGSATVKWEASGSYSNVDADAPEFTISYAWVAPDQTMSSSTVYEHQISVPWSHEESLVAGTGVSMSLTGLDRHTNSMTLKIYEDGVLKASHTISGTVTDGSFHPNASGIVHVVGQ
jgi:hypothetical protein